MKILITVVLISVLGVSLARVASTQDHNAAKSAMERYPDVYTLDAARDLMASGDQSVSLWYCINLYSDHPVEVLDLICGQRETSDDLVLAVKVSFGANSAFDPAISDIISGALNIDGTALARKGAWADSLCADIGRELIEKYFVNDLLHLLAEDFEELMVPSQTDSLWDRVQRTIGELASSDDVGLHIHYLKTRQGNEVLDKDNEVVSRTNIAVLSVKDPTTCDSVWDSVLVTMELRPPLSDELPEALKSPPTVLVKGSRSIVLVKFRCEDFLATDGVQDDSAFWQQAESIAELIKGCQPERVLACGCGGPLRSLDHTEKTFR